MPILNSLYDHHRNILEYMNEERKKQSLCDVKLVVSGEVVHAHKSVLAAESEYFRTLFHGQFSDSNQSEIDLTSAVKNADDLEKVVNFIYTCNIEITAQNLADLARLASFFLMNNMRVKVKDYMMNKLSRDTCLQYYLCAKEVGFSNVEGMASLMVKAGFHNYLINMDKTLDVTPEDLEDFQVKGFLNFCEISQLVDFIAKWVGTHHSEKHATVACRVLKAVMVSNSDFGKSSLTKKQVEKSFKKMLTSQTDAGLKPDNNRKVADFVDTLQRALVEGFGSVAKREIENRSDGSTSTSKVKRRKTEPADKSQNKIALVTIGKIRDENDNDDDDENSDFDWCSDDKPLDVCVYVPSSQCWFHYCTVPVESIAFTSDFYEDKKIVDFCLINGDIVTYSYNDHSLLFFNHKKKSGSTVTKQTLVDSRGQGSLLDSFFTVHNDTLYMINRFLEYESCSASDLNEQQERVHLIGYRLNDKMKFVKVFETEPLSVTGGFEYDKDCGPVRDTQIKISSKTDEVLIIHSTFDCISPASTVVYLAKLRARNSTVKVLLNTKDEKKLLRECHIVETDDRFLIVGEDNKKIRVLCEYVFLSEQISYKTGYVPGERLYDSCNTKTFPNTVTINGTHCLWHFEVYLQKVTVLKSADFTEDKKMVVSEHVSAPFTRIFSVYETRLPEAFLNTLKKMP
ncbi:uncharacterized protein LOC123541062 [Mercenaria mercenaria]|uniref:uncharacterized protein LOC123541062 n=1 Tax=Mercenaria mercenaria TaxID=6596 RepID=UPI00234EF8F3|nr:uncharacterized protein LOC123541062 [Mercenaria mercenaria]